MSLGFSLIELMITLSIAGVLLAVGVPNFKAFIQNQKLVATASEFYGAINMTRAEAIKRGDKVDMIATDGADWSKGWTIYVDANDNHKIDLGETIIFNKQVTAQGITISSNFTDSATPYISYTGNGRSRTYKSSQTPQAGTATFTFGASIRKVKINFLGRARICNPAIDTKTCDNNVTGN